MEMDAWEKQLQQRLMDSPNDPKLRKILERMAKRSSFEIMDGSGKVLVSDRDLRPPTGKSTSPPRK